MNWTATKAFISQRMNTGCKITFHLTKDCSVCHASQNNESDPKSPMGPTLAVSDTVLTHSILLPTRNASQKHYARLEKEFLVCHKLIFCKLPKLFSQLHSSLSLLFGSLEAQRTDCTKYGVRYCREDEKTICCFKTISGNTERGAFELESYHHYPNSRTCSVWPRNYWNLEKRLTNFRFRIG